MTEHPFACLKQRADVLKCCKDVRNLLVQRLRPDLLRAVCLRCNRGHRKLLCEPGSLFVDTLKAMSTLQPARMLYGPGGEVVVAAADGYTSRDIVVKR